MQRVLLCDDEVMNRKVAKKILTKEGYEVVEAENGEIALNYLKNEPFDLILMDLMMPVMDGYTATEIIKNDEKLATIPLIIISALSDREAIHQGLALGADEYLTKPFDLIEFKLRVKNALKMNHLQDQKSEKEILHIMAQMAEFRDNETSQHTLRVGEFSALLAKHYGWSDEEVELIRLAAPMHDIGKIGIPDAILLKPGKLSDEEFEKMKKHVTIGYHLLSHKQTPLLQLAAEIAYTHHEKFDGSGYPRGLKGDEIPISGAIVAIVDVFDALTSKRPYKEPFSMEKTLEILKDGREQHFHPELLDLFFEHLNEVIAIQHDYQDS
ncbi:MAG: two-component system response regulator [Hydrogenimonas sp.]|nr:MAG: two-component system response regulator [Hydrogenimonas sp.]